MTSKLEEVIRSLCCKYSWSYGIYWRLHGGDSGLLTTARAYYEDQMGNIMADVLKMTHRIGEGVIGVAALNGRTSWIFSDTHLKEQNLTVYNNSHILPDDDALSVQFLAGIKTIATLPLQPFGVMQFGSSHKISENLEFLNQVKDIIQNTELLSEMLLCQDPNHIDETHNSCGVFTSVASTVEFIPSFDDNSYIYNSCFESVRRVKQQCTVSAISSNSTLDSLGNTLSMPLPKSNPFSKNPSLEIRQIPDTSAGDQFPSSSNTGLYQDFSKHNCNSLSLVGSNHWSNTSNDKILALMENQLLNIIGSQDFSATSEPIVPHDRITTGSYGDKAPTSFNSSVEVHDHRLYNSPHPLASSSFPISKIYEHSRDVLLQEPRIPVEPKMDSLSFLSIYEDMITECATSSISKSDTVMKYDAAVSTVPRNDSSQGAAVLSSGFNGSGDLSSFPLKESSSMLSNMLVTYARNSLGARSSIEGNSSNSQVSMISNHLFEGANLDLTNSTKGNSYWEDIIGSGQNANCSNLSTSILDYIPNLDASGVGESQENRLPDFGLEQLVNSVTSGHTNSGNCKSSGGTINSDVGRNSGKHYSDATCGGNNIPAYRNQIPLSSLGGVSISVPNLSECNNITQASSSAGHLKSQVSSWIDDCYSLNVANSVTLPSKKLEEQVKMPKKRARPGESTRPRPKDRQLIQDRVKELRELVPNGAKCSIDSLLDRTIKHMLYLQNVTRYAEKIKQTDESKMIGDESGVVLRDNTNCGSAGATWAFEVAGQTMVCPIIVEDLSPPGQMLVEMLCEERGLFLEIAEIVRGFGLIILKGVMEVRNSKIWARFLVEANREVTRMEIFLSLVQLLQQTSSNTGGSTARPTKEKMETDVLRFDDYSPSPLPIPNNLPDGLHECIHSQRSCCHWGRHHV